MPHLRQTMWRHPLRRLTPSKNRKPCCDSAKSHEYSHDGAADRDANERKLLHRSHSLPTLPPNGRGSAVRPASFVSTEYSRGSVAACYLHADAGLRMHRGPQAAAGFVGRNALLGAPRRSQRRGGARPTARRSHAPRSRAPDSCPTRSVQDESATRGWHCSVAVVCGAASREPPGWARRAFVSTHSRTGDRI